MAGSDNYKEFDTSSIVTNASSAKNSITFRNLTFRKRDILLAGIAIVALLGVIILAILLATQAANKSSCSSPSYAASSSNNQVDDASLPFCVTKECLKAAVYQKPLLEAVADPCDDFYNFACGNYAEHNPRTPLMVDVTPTQQILWENTEKLIYLLDYPVTRTAQHSYARKMKHFMQSCNNHFDKMSLRGSPLIHEVIDKVGGWYLFDTFDVTTFDLPSMLQKVHITFWTPAFFNVMVNTNQKDWNKNIVELGSGGLGLRYPIYYQTTKIQNDYKAYMTTMAKLLLRDNNMATTGANVTSKIEQFVMDAFNVEVALTRILSNTSIVMDVHSTDSKISLKELSKHLNNTLDIVGFMKTLFNDAPSHFTPETEVALMRMNFFNQLGPLLSEYLSDEDGKRQLHNYMIWQLINTYSHDLSWEYLHARRKLDHDIFGYKDDSSGFVYCFRMAENVFSQAASALFVKNFVRTENKNEAEAMLDRIKTAILEGIHSLAWMSEEDRDTSINKIQNSLFKIGFPDYMVDDNFMDALYSGVNIDVNNYFGNILNLNKMARQRMNDAIKNANARTLWAYHVFSPKIQYYNPWHELIVTSAVLQNPLYSSKGSAYYNYGGVGSMMALSLIHAIDEYGNRYKLDGSSYGSWWSNTTTQHYQQLRQCAMDAQKNEVLGPFQNFFGVNITVKPGIFANSFAPQMLADASGIRLSFKAYKLLEREEGIEKLPPGFQKFTPDKMFFVTYAQTYCQNTPDYLKLNNLRAGTFPGKERVNMILRQVPEFQQTFQCSSTSRMSAKKRCVMFDV